ncbi:hypothetical protein [Aliikangiella maris]|uniref:Uncharacterized protein n=2 Tax=Aliikangiella maris TaxID=3162458 RepID=A0ABV3MKQ3_9GAMM
MNSTIARNNMLVRFNDRSMKVGSTYVKNNPGDYSKYTITDCVTFVLNVLRDTYIQMGRTDVASNLASKGLAKRGNNKKPLFYGDMLAKYLVNQLSWKAIYLTPDRFHPNDGSKEHTFATAKAIENCAYVGVPLSYLVLDYNPTPKKHPKFQALYDYKGPRKLNVIGLAELKKIKFAYGLSRQGDHTWLYSNGYVYEAHWNAIGSNVYSKHPISKFIWNSNMLIVPPDSIASLTLKNLTECK